MVIRVMIVSAIRLYREGLERTLAEDEHIHIVGTAAFAFRLCRSGYIRFRDPRWQRGRIGCQYQSGCRR